MTTANSVNAQQTGLWFIHETDPGCSAYHIVFGAEVTADPRLGVQVREILADLSREHDALRIGFRAGPEGPEQFVRDEVPLDIRHTDARETAPRHCATSSARTAAAPSTCPNPRCGACTCTAPGSAPGCSPS